MSLKAALKGKAVPHVLCLGVFALASAAFFCVRGEEQHSVFTALQSTTLNGYVDTSASWWFGTSVLFQPPLEISPFQVQAITIGVPYEGPGGVANPPEMSAGPGSIVPVPEPSSGALVIAAIAGISMASVRRLRRHEARAK